MTFVGLDFIKLMQAAQFTAAHPVTKATDTIPPAIQAIALHSYTTECLYETEDKFLGIFVTLRN